LSFWKADEGNAHNQANRRPAARIMFCVQDMVDSNLKLYKQITGNPDFAEDLLTWMFQRYLKTKRPDKA